MISCLRVDENPSAVFVIDEPVRHEARRLVVLVLVVVDGPGVGEEDGAFGKKKPSYMSSRVSMCGTARAVVRRQRRV